MGDPSLFTLALSAIVAASGAVASVALLARIATALERIADTVENTAPGGVVDVKVR